MLAVQAAHNGLVSAIKTGEIFNMKPVIQDKKKQIRYTKNCDFNDEVASKYLNSLPTPSEVGLSLKNRSSNLLLHTYIE